MRRWVLLGLAATAVVAWLLSERGEAPLPTDRDTPGEKNAQVPSSGEGPADHRGVSARTSSTQNSTAPMLPERPVTVVVDEGPQRPGEPDYVYQNRLELARTFRSFREEAGLTDNQAQALLRALYDLQQNADTLATDRRGSDLEPDDWLPLLDEYLQDFRLRYYGILTDRQRRLWRYECSICLIYARDGALRLEEHDLTQ